MARKIFIGNYGEDRNTIKKHIRDKFDITDSFADKFIRYLSTTSLDKEDVESIVKQQGKASDRPSLQVSLTHHENAIAHTLHMQKAWTGFVDTVDDPNPVIRHPGHSELLLRRLTLADHLLSIATLSIAYMLASADKPSAEIPLYGRMLLEKYLETIGLFTNKSTSNTFSEARIKLLTASPLERFSAIYYAVTVNYAKTNNSYFTDNELKIIQENALGFKLRKVQNCKYELEVISDQENPPDFDHASVAMLHLAVSDISQATLSGVLDTSSLTEVLSSLINACFMRGIEVAPRMFFTYIGEPNHGNQKAQEPETGTSGGGDEREQG
jgi:hypothetical protein